MRYYGGFNRSICVNVIPDKKCDIMGDLIEVYV